MENAARMRRFLFMLFANPKPRRSAYHIRLRGTHRAKPSPYGSVWNFQTFFPIPQQGAVGRPQLGNIRPKRSIFAQIGVKNARHPTGCLRFLPEFASKLLSFRVQKQFWDTDFSLRCNNEKYSNADALLYFFVVIERKRWFQNRFFPIWGRPYSRHVFELYKW